MRCPNCSYKLVLLSHRRKYKCAKCGNLFFQKFIEDKEFQQWNKFQRELDPHNIDLERKQRKIEPKLTEEERRQRINERQRLWRLKNREYLRIKDRERHSKNKDKINARRKRRWKENNEYLISTRKARRYRNIWITRLQSRIDYWKYKQKVLADSMLKNRLYKAYTYKLTHSVPTFLHCELLF